MPIVRYKIDCRITANCCSEDSVDLSDEEYADFCASRDAEEDGGYKWLAENVIDPEFLHPDIIVRDGRED